MGVFESHTLITTHRIIELPTVVSSGVAFWKINMVLVKRSLDANLGLEPKSFNLNHGLTYLDYMLFWRNS